MRLDLRSLMTTCRETLDEGCLVSYKMQTCLLIRYIRVVFYAACKGLKDVHHNVSYVPVQKSVRAEWVVHI